MFHVLELASTLSPWSCCHTIMSDYQHGPCFVIEISAILANPTYYESDATHKMLNGNEFVRVHGWLVLKNDLFACQVLRKCSSRRPKDHLVDDVGGPLLKNLGWTKVVQITSIIPHHMLPSHMTLLCLQVRSKNIASIPSM